MPAYLKSTFARRVAFLPARGLRKPSLRVAVPVAKRRGLKLP